MNYDEYLKGSPFLTSLIETIYNTLFDTGECANPKASGGEDTYTAAKSIEGMRKEKGEWNASKSNKKQRPGSGKGQSNSNKGKDQKKRPA